VQISKTFAEYKTLFFNVPINQCANWAMCQCADEAMCQCADEAMCQFKTHSIINPTVIASKAKLSA
jgi:hypothetical protein